jgi:sugar lactone lactonase YvrE
MKGSNRPMVRSLIFVSRRLVQHRRARFTAVACLCLLLAATLSLNWQAISQAATKLAQPTAATPAGQPATAADTTRRTTVKATATTVKRDDLAQQQTCTVGCTATVPATGQTNQQISFASTSTLSGCATQATYEWDFGDGSTRSTQQNPTKTYTAPGSYNWRLTVSAGAGNTTIDTVAGGVGENSPAKMSPYFTPVAIARDPQNRGIYVVDQGGGNYVLRFINTTNASVTVAGKEVSAGTNRVLVGGGNDDLSDNVPGTQSVPFDANGIAAHPNGNLVFYVGQQPARVRVLNVSSATQTVAGKTVGVGNVTTVAEIPGADTINAVAVNANGDVFVASPTAGVNKVFRVTAAGQVSTFAGNGAATKSSDAFLPGAATNVPLLGPRALEFDPSGNLYIADAGHQRVIRVDTSFNATLTAQFTIPAVGAGPHPSGLAWLNSNLYVALSNAQTIVRVTNGQAIVGGKDGVSCDYSTTNCGDGGPGTAAGFFMLGSSAQTPLANIDADQNGIYIPDQGSIQRGRIRYLNLTSAPVVLAGTTINPNSVDTIAGIGLAPPYDGAPAISALLGVDNGVAVDANNNLWITDSPGRLRFVNRGASALTLFPNTQAAQVVPAGAIVTVNKDAGSGQPDNVPASQAAFETPQGLFVNAQGVFIADSKGGQSVGNDDDKRRTSRIRFINTTNSPVTIFPNSGAPVVVPPGFIRTVAGGSENSALGNGGVALEAKFLGSADVAVASNGDIYVADVGNKAVRKILSANGVVSSLNLPAAEYTGLAFDTTGRLYVVNNDNGQILRETAAGSGTFTVMGTVNKPHDVAVNASGDAFVTSSEHKIFRISSTGQVSTVAGSTVGFEGDGGPAANAKLNLTATPIGIGAITVGPFVDVTIGIAINAAGEVFFNDIGNNRVRRIGAGAATCVRTGTITVTGSQNPVPTITNLSPNSRGVNGGAFSLTVTGTNFVQGSQVRWNGQGRPTSFVNSTQLTAQIPANDLATAGTAQVTVFNPEPGGGASNALAFSITAQNPAPVITGLTPGTAAVGAGFTLTVTGTGFINGSVVRWNDSNRPTTFVNDTTLTAQIPASDLTTTGQAEITVVTPAPGGGTSNIARFTITAQNAAPTLTSISPSAVSAGGQAFTLTATGTGFAVTSRIRVNGQDRSTSLVNGGQLAAQIPPSDIATAGVLNITVFTPTPGGGVTQALPLTVGTLATNTLAASFAANNGAAEAIMALFGVEMATEVKIADSLPLPTTLAGTTVRVRDSAWSRTARAALLRRTGPDQLSGSGGHGHRHCRRGHHLRQRKSFGRHAQRPERRARPVHG